MAYPVTIYLGDSVLCEREFVSGVTLTVSDGDRLLVREGGEVSRITVSSDCLIELEDGACAESIHLLSEGFALVKAGACVDGVTIDNGAILNLYGIAEAAEVSGVMYLHDSATLSTSMVDAEGLVSLWGQESVAEDIIVNGILSAYYGQISDVYALDGGRIRLGNDAHAECVVLYEGTSLDASSGAALHDITAMGNTLLRFASGVVLTGDVCFSSPISISGEIDAAGADFIIALDGGIFYDTPLIQDWSLCTPRSLTVAISEELSQGSYLIAGNVESVPQIAVLDESGMEVGKCSESRRLGSGDYIFSMGLSDGELSFCAEYCTFVQMDDGLVLRSDSDEITIFCVQNGAHGATTWRHDSELTYNEHVIKEHTDNSRWDASSMECPVVFYAEPSGTWRGNYKAWNANTGDYISIAGKGRFDGIYMGAPNLSMIMLTAEDDALFSDDIFTAFPEGNARQSRIAFVAEIRAGDGDDIIDMTNEHFTDGNAQITLRGGAGNDIIWSANDGARLFGDAGDDILVGGFGNDIICGGVGDDTLRGLGGFDIFAFGFDSGNDTIILDDGDFLLWFEEGISLSDDDITIDGDCAVISFGMFSSLTMNNLPDGSLADRLLCGDCGEHAGMTYAALAELGAFDSDSTPRIFNTIA